MIKKILAKSLLSPLKGGRDPYFGICYNMNLYRGCQHQCIYCDSRSLCYGIKNFSDILIKENAHELLERELKHKRKKGTIGTGSMNDPYMPIEKPFQMTRGALKIILKYNYPVHILTKSALVLRDIDLIKEIGQIYSAVSLTITSSQDSLAKQIEPGASSTSERFNALKKFALSGVYSGVIMTPILPFITDSERNIRGIVEQAADNGAKYIIAWMGTTQRSGQREYFYNELDKLFPGIKERYISLFGVKYSCPSPDCSRLWDLFVNLCDKYNIPTKMNFYEYLEKNIQPALF